jgi:hypothetical protein
MTVNWRSPRSLRPDPFLRESIRKWMIFEAASKITTGRPGPAPEQPVQNPPSAPRRGLFSVNTKRRGVNVAQS